MPSYCISFRPKRMSEAKAIAFEAADAGAALSIAFRHVGSQAADLWCDGQMLCRIECPDESGGFWLIS